MLPSILAILAGLVLLVAGGEVLVRGASNIAAAIGMSPLVVGLTVVSFATSAPEFAVTMKSVAAGSPGLAVGNVVGSNIANILLVLGIAAIITPLAVKSRVVRFDVPVMIGLSLIVTVMAFNGVIARWQGAILVVLLAVYVIWTVRIGRSDPEGEKEKLDPDWIDGELRPEPVAERSTRNMLASVVMVAVGIGALVLGASVLVSGATTIASALGLSDLVIGLTIVAVGTSLPELATSIVAALRGERDLAVGNAVGSNIFNLGAVLGFAAILSPDGIVIPEGAQNLDFLLMTGVAILLLPVVYTGYAVGRWEGILFVSYYVAYTTYLLLMSSEHESLAPFSTVMLAFVIPLTFLFLIVLAVAEHSRRHRPDVPAPPEAAAVE
jgi:cation:H+ antiporter